MDELHPLGLQLEMAIMFSSLENNCSKVKKTSLEEMKLKGKVKSLKITTYDTIVEDGRIVEKKLSPYVETFSFDSKGSKIESATYYKDSLHNKSIYLYDDQGNNLESSMYNLDGLLESKIIRKYDDRGRKMESLHYRRYSLIEKKTSKYDDRGNKIVWIYEGRDESFEIRWIYQYNDNVDSADYFHTVEHLVYKSDKSLVYRRIYKYDDKGNRVETLRYNPDGSFEGTTTYKYGNLGNILEIASYNPNGTLVSRDLDKYDDRGNIIESAKYYFNNALYSTSFFKYDEHNNQIEQIRVYQDKPSTDQWLTEYTYNDCGDWIRRFEYFNMTTCKITERVIDYYDAPL